MTAVTPIEGRAAWKGPQIDYASDGLHTLSAEDIAEIDAALGYLKSRGPLDFPAITAAAFPLPRLHGFFAEAAEELRHGRRFLLLRGLPRERYSLDDLALVYYGLGTHLGRPVPQSYQGELLGHVIDVSDIELDARGYHKGGGQRMHSDNCDVVSLMCVRAARAGGISRIVSAAAVHNALLEQRPDLLEALYSEYVFRRMERDAELGNGELVKRVVIFSRESGELTCNISGSYPFRAVRAGDAVMTPRQVEALEEMKRLSASPDLYLDMNIGEGDIQFLNNRTILHGRTGYEDWPDITERRHMLRVWLEMPDWPPLPANQGVHGAADDPFWLPQRTPFMEVPSRYLAEMSRRKAEAAA